MITATFYLHLLVSYCYALTSYPTLTTVVLEHFYTIFDISARCTGHFCPLLNKRGSYRKIQSLWARESKFIGRSKGLFEGFGASVIHWGENNLKNSKSVWGSFCALAKKCLGVYSADYQPEKFSSTPECSAILLVLFVISAAHSDPTSVDNT